MEPGQQFEHEYSECVGDDLFDILEDRAVVWRVAVVKLGVYDGGSNCFGGVKIKVGTDTAESTNVMVAGFRQCRYLIRFLSNMKPRLSADWVVSIEVEEL